MMTGVPQENGSTSPFMNSMSRIHENKNGRIGQGRRNGLRHPLSLGETIVHGSSWTIVNVAAVFNPPSAAEVLGIDKNKTRAGILKALWMVLVLFICGLLIAILWDLTNDYLKENTGTLISSEHVDLEWLKKHVKYTICLRDWVNATKLNGTELSPDELRYLSGFLTYKAVSMMTDEEVAVAKSQIDRKIEKLKPNGLKKLFFSLVQNPFGNRHEIGMDNLSFAFGGPDFSTPCITSTVSYMLAPLGNFVQNGEIELVLDQDVDWINLSFNYSDSFASNYFYHHYSGGRMTAIASGYRHTMEFPNSFFHHFITLKHFHFHNGSKKPCRNNTGHEFVPLGYARDLCAFQCTDDAVFKKIFNCSIRPLFDETTASPQYPRQCNYIDFSNNGTVWNIEMRDKILSPIQNSSCMSECTKERFCHEYFLERRIVERSNVRCFDQRLQRCQQVNIFGWIDSTAELYKEYLLRTWNTVLSDYGGQIGLFVGVSMLSVVHLIIYWIAMCLGLSRGHNSRSNMRN